MPIASEPAEILGKISGSTPRIAVEVKGSPPAHLDEVVVDTGFAGGLRVPAGFFARMGIRPMGSTLVALADDFEQMCPVGLLTVDWFGVSRRIEAMEFGTEALLGMKLLDHVRIDLLDERVRLTRI